MKLSEKLKLWFANSEKDQELEMIAEAESLEEKLKELESGNIYSEKYNYWRKMEKENQRLKELLKKADLRILRDYRGRERIGTAIEWTPTDDERKLIQELNPKNNEGKTR